MRRRFFLATLLLTIALPVMGQSTRRDMIVSADWLAERLDGQVILIEVGEKGDYETAHIPSARFLARSALLRDIDNVPNEIPPVADFEAEMTALGVGNKTRVVFYSRDPLLATRAWFTFDYFGHGHRASVLNGGYARWVGEGKKTTTDVPAFVPAKFESEPNPAAVANLRVMKILVHTRNTLGPSLVIIDARPQTSYRGELAGSGVARAGHIPGAISVPWQRNLTDDALFRGDHELRSLYAGLGAKRETTLITYCRTGVEASMTYFVLRYLGFDASLYDGSFVEWSRDGNTPVV
ncbi:MAG: sulfurtransferase [Thermoanaerobaculia bacterium]